MDRKTEKTEMEKYRGKYQENFLKILLWVCLCALCACGRPGKTGGADGAKAPQPEASAAPVIDWRSIGFAVSEEVEEKPELWISEYDVWDDDRAAIDPETEKRNDQSSFGFEVHVCGSVLYRLTEIVDAKGGDPSKTRWVLESYDVATGERTERPFSRADLGIGEEEMGLLIRMDVPAPDSYVFEYCRYEETEEGFRMTGLEMIRTDLRGEAIRTDMRERYLEDGILKEEFAEELYELYMREECVCDGKGNTYRTSDRIDYGATRLTVYSREGERLLSYQAGEQEIIGPMLRTPDGEIVCTVYGWRKKSYTFLWADTEQGEMRRLGEMKVRSNDISFHGMQGNTVYYETMDGKTVKWDIGTGRRQVVFVRQDNGITKRDNTRLVLMEEGTPVLWMQCGRYPDIRQFVVRLSGEEISESDKIRVADIASDRQHIDGKEQIPDCAALASQVNPGRIFTYETSMDAEAYRDRILAQLAAGEGPEILYVSREDMFMLEEKGLLADLREFIPRERLEEILPGVLELGTVDGKLAGLTPNVSAYSIAVSRDVWEKDHWRLEDMLELIGEGKLEPLVWWFGYNKWNSLSTIEILEYLFNDSFLIDWEKRECHFDDDRVVRLLELSLREEEGPEDLESALVLNGGNRMARIYLGTGGRVALFGADVLRENGNYVGYPTEGSCGNYLIDDGFIVVNKNTASREDIEAFLGCLLSKSIQNTLSMREGVQITRLKTEDITTDEEGRVTWQDAFELYVFEDGTTSFHKAIEFLDSCVACPRVDLKMENILREELAPMYAGDRTPEQTAEILNNRIGLYLKETE